MGFDIFDPSQWADVTGLVVVLVMACLTLLGAAVKVAAGGRWVDWLDEARGRGSVDDPWEDQAPG